MSIDSLKDVYIDQLQDLYSACAQSATVTGELAAAATNHDLKEALKRGESGIRNGLESLSSLASGHNANPANEHCKGMEGLVAEARAHALDESFGDDDTQDAMIITQYQRMAHYAIAGYGCLKAFANRLDLEQEADTLSRCLDACYDGDRTMSKLAETQINAAAA